MNYFLLFLLYCAVSGTLYPLALALLRVPSRRLRSQTLKLLHHSRKGVSFHDQLALLSSVTAKLIPLGDYQRRRLAATLTAAGLGVTPEYYLADCLVRAALIGLLAAPAFLLSPIFGVLLLVLAVLFFFQFRGKAQLLVRRKREALELELPRFVATLAQELHHDNNLQRIFKSYQKHAALILREELGITLADMMSGNEEAALTRWESRMNSAMLSEVIRGLQAVKRGDQGEVYFTMLSHDFRQAEVQRLKLEATLRPQKMNIYSAMILFAFVVTIFVVMLTSIQDNIQVFF